MNREQPRRTLEQIKHIPPPKTLYKTLIESKGWPYINKPEYFLIRDRALVATLYLGDLRSEEALPLTTENFEKTPTYIWLKDIVVGKKKHGKITYRESKFPYKGERTPFTELIEKYLELLKPGQRLFPWSLEKKTFKVGTYTLKDGTIKDRISIKMVGTTRAWQIVNALLPEYTQHWLRAFGYNYDYDHMDHDIMAVSDKTKADPRSLQPYLRRRYEKYPIR
jgi:hypothetical protein